MQISSKLNGLAHLQKQLKADRKNEIKALETAIRVEGFRLRKLLKQEIRAGDPGGRQFAPLSMIARRLNRTSKPLRKLANSVKYQVNKTPFSLALGWPGNAGKTWRRIALAQQEGYEFSPSPGKVRFFRWAGSKLSKRSKYRKYFFLRKDTKTLEVPARPIIEPFWAAHENSAWHHIRDNYRRKLAGERI